MKTWPKDGSMLLAQDPIDPLYRSAKKLLAIRPEAMQGAKYTGYDVPSTAHCCLPPRDHLSKEGLEYNREQGRDPLMVVLLVAFQLGYEQGRRSRNEVIKMLELTVETQGMLLKSEGDE
jgi:hypothetical protein